jgi:hypothetical protein
MAMIRTKIQWDREEEEKIIEHVCIYRSKYKRDKLYKNKTHVLFFSLVLKG